MGLARGLGKLLPCGVCGPVMVKPSAGMGGGGSPFSPRDIDSLLQFALEPSQDAYYGTTLNGVHYLASRESYGTWRAPRKGYCHLYDGSNDYGRVSFSQSGVTQMTLCIDVKDVASSNGTRFISVGNTSQRGFDIRKTSTGFDLVIASSASAYTIYASTAVSLSSFCKIVATINGTTVKAYADGTEVTLTPTASGGGFNGTLSTIENITIGATSDSTASSFCNAKLRDVRIYSAAKDATFAANYHVGDYANPDKENGIAGYWCNEEAGTTGYNWMQNAYHLTLSGPITESTFHATDTSITANPTNIHGGTLSGSVVIPITPGETTDVLGNAPTWTGECPYPVRVDTPCITFNGSSDYAVATSRIGTETPTRLTVEYAIKPDGTANKVRMSNGMPSNASTGWEVQSGASNGLKEFFYFGASGAIAESTNAVTSTSLFTKCRWEYDGTLTGNSNRIKLFVNDSQVALTFTGTIPSSISSDTTRFELGRYPNGAYAAMSICDVRISENEIVLADWACQEGPGPSNTNRTLYDKSGNDHHLTVTLGTVATQWANRCPGYVQDQAILNGAGIDSNGAVIPVVVATGLCADGSTPTQNYNPYSRVNFNPFTAAEANGLGLETAYAVGTARQSVSPTDTKFGASDGTRFFATKEASTGAELTSAEEYVS